MFNFISFSFNQEMKINKQSKYELFRSHIDQYHKLESTKQWWCYEHRFFTFVLDCLCHIFTMYFIAVSHLFRENWILIVYLRNDTKKLIKSGADEFVFQESHTYIVWFCVGEAERYNSTFNEFP